MENSMNETEAHQSFRSPPRRRRSTFFERRDSIVPYTNTENLNPKKSKEAEENERHSEDLTRYYQKLLAEKEIWKKEVNERRNKYHDLRQQYQIAAKAPSRSQMSYSALSNEDIEFLKGKPNISKIVDSQQKLHKSVLETQALYRKVNELDDVILSQSERIVNKVTEYILENSTVAPVD